jgi:hypothetical protein
MSDEQTVLLPVGTFNKVIDYLMNQPYSGVSGLIEDIKQNARAVEAQPEVQPEVDDGAE